VHLAGSGLALTAKSEDIDGFSDDGDGLDISLLGALTSAGVTGADEDVFHFAGSFGAQTSGTLTKYWDVWGSPQDLTQKVSVLEQRFSEDESAEICTKLGSRGGLVGTPDQLRSIAAEYRAAVVDEIIVPDFTVTVEKRNDLLDRFRREVIDA
jgi:hypothetical protein